MSLSYSAFFDARRGYYRARRWGSVGKEKVDGAVRIPDKWWRERGFDPPTQSTERADKMALRFAAAEAQRLEQHLTNRAKLSTGFLDKANLKQVFELMKESNPRLVGRSTLDKWEHDFAKIAEFIDPHMLPEDVTMATATQYRNWRMSQKRDHTERNVRSRTVRNELVFLRQLVRFALDFQDATGAAVIRFNRIPELAREDSLKVALTVEEFREVHKAAAERDRDILWTGVSTLLRKHNLLGFDGSWIDLDRSWLTISRELLKGGRRKNRNDLDVPIAKATAETLKRYEIKSGPIWPNSRTGKPLTWYEHVLEDLATKTGVRPFSLHDLRDTGMSWLYANGVQDLVVKRLAGHAESGDVTHSYIQIFEKELRSAVDVFDEIVGSVLG